MSKYAIVDLVGDRALPARHGVLALAGQREVSVLAVQGCVRYKPDRDDVLFTQAEYASAIDEIPAADLVIT
ncbi:metallophosphoesterase, partial [Mycobacteroides abscessus subsp. abscessus]